MSRSVAHSLRAVTILICFAAAGYSAPATQPSPSASDPATDWLLGQATPVPATQPADGARPASRPTSPFAGQADPESRAGLIVLSSGEKIHANLSTTPQHPFRVWDEQAKEYRDVPLSLVQSMQAQVLWERQEREWRFKESGSDIKEYSGKSYPAREVKYVITLNNGQTITGGVVAPIYARAKGQSATYVLYKRQKGQTGQTLKQLVYIERIEFAGGKQGN